MKIATGYFAKARAYHNMGYALVSVARTRPWFLSKELLLWHISDLAPTGEIIGAKNNPRVYEEKYTREILAKTSPEKVLSELERLVGFSGKNKVVLLCYEAPNKFCHRHLIARWLSDKIGEQVEEICIEPKEETLF